MITDSKLLHPIAFQTPRRITTASAWVEHTPFAMNLVALLRPRLFVELGTHSGDSYCAFCQGVDALGLETRCFAIDTWEGDPHAGEYGPELLAGLRAHHDPQYGRFSTLVQNTFDEALAYFDDGSIDLLHIDGYHTFERVKADYESWSRKLTPDAVVLLHDTNVRERGFGVWRLWEELRARGSSFEFLHGHGLGIVAPGPITPDALGPLFAADEARTEELRAIFFALGQRVAFARQLQGTTEQWRAEVGKAAALERERDAAMEQAAALRTSAEDAAALRSEVVRREAEQTRLETERTGLEAERTRLEAELARLEAELAGERAAREQAEARSATMASDIAVIQTSRSWQLVQRYRTTRDRVVALTGKARKIRNVSGVRGAATLVRTKLAQAAAAQPPGSALRAVAAALPATLDDVVRARFPAIQPLRVITSPDRRPRLNLVTDSLGATSLFGGVGTSIVLATLLAERRNLALRVVTRTEPPEPQNFGRVLAANGIKYERNPEFAWIDVGDAASSLDVSEGDVFLTTSWWTTRSVLGSIGAERVIYLLQEDERMFYPLGDEHLRCAELLGHPNLRIVVNSRILFDHLVASGYPGLERSGVWFEPSFPPTAFHAEGARRTGKRKFLFYARPHNQRNLFYRGIEAIDAAVARGVLDLDEWELYFVGKDLPPVRIGSCEPHRIEAVPWDEYAALIRSIDLGLCLMYTPHPSYPPLDIAASGGVAVTNRFDGKQDLDRYSPNILCRDLDVNGLVEGLADGVRLAKDDVQRRQNYERNGLLRDWRASFADVLAAIEGT